MLAKPEHEEIDMSQPAFYYQQGRHLQLVPNSHAGTKSVRIEHETNRKVFCNISKERPDLYLVSWGTSDAKGEFRIDNIWLKQLFGHKPDLTILAQANHHQKLTQKNKVDFFRPGHGCRKGPYLTIPNIGTGCSDDSCLSVLLTPEISDAVLNLIEDEA